MCLPVGEQEVDDRASNWEDEDEHRPKDFIRDRAVGLQNLDCGVC